MKKHMQLALLFSFFVLTLLLLTSPKAYAATPPDSCFDFDSGTGTILGYYETENNNPGDPACTKDVDIPSAIGGTPVTVIGNSAFQAMDLTDISIPNSVVSLGNNVFRENQLTSVTIPSSITSISDGAFLENQLTAISLPGTVTAIGIDAFGSNQLAAVTIPNSVTTIGERAFMINNLTSLTLPSSVTLIDTMAFAANQIESVTLPASVTTLSPYAFIFQTTPGGTSYQEALAAYNSGDPEIIQSTAEQFVQSIIYTTVFTADPANPEGLADGIMTEVDFGDIDGDGDQDSSLGGHLVNPASVTVNYHDTTGADLQPPQTVTGLNLLSYVAAENAANDLNLYYKIGSTHTLTPPNIAGYTAPAANNFTFASATNSLTFVYSSTTGGAGASAGGGLADTGQSQSMWLVLITALSTVSLAVVVKKLRSTS